MPYAYMLMVEQHRMRITNAVIGCVTAEWEIFFNNDSMLFCCITEPPECQPPAAVQPAEC